MYRFLAPTPGSLASGYFWKIRLYPALTKIFWMDLSTNAVDLHVDYLQLEVMKLVSARHHLSDLTV